MLFLLLILGGAPGVAAASDLPTSVTSAHHNFNNGGNSDDDDDNGGSTRTRGRNYDQRSCAEIQQMRDVASGAVMAGGTLAAIPTGFTQGVGMVMMGFGTLSWGVNTFNYYRAGCNG